MSGLVERIGHTVAHPRWGGGLHRDHLAELLKVDPHGRRFVAALMIAERRRLVQFCGPYVAPGKGIERQEDVEDDQDSS